tara:strand:+ start:943 stop:1299 length:357 start_codon:yes stop_codon:yes gene_type:complete
MIDATHIALWLAKLKQGRLSPADLEQALQNLKKQPAESVQRLLYLQTHTTDLESPVIGMALVEGAQVFDGPDDPDDWPYQTVLEAMADGWHIIKFPELTMVYLDPDYGGMKWEFVLEK